MRKSYQRKAKPKSVSEGRWLSVPEIAKHLGISTVTIYRWLEDGRIPASRVGKQWRFKQDKVDRWVTEGGACN